MATDAASLIIKVDASQALTGAASLDRLAASGARAEAAAVGLGSGTKSAAAAATAMAAEAQLSSRAAMGMATGFGAATSAAKLNTIAMRETLVVARELSRGNFTRIPGSLTLLAANTSGGLSGYAASLATTFGLIKKVQNAELAEQATNAAVAATAVQGAAERAASNIVAADTELALAQAQVRVAVGSDAEAVAQARVAAAHEAVTAAAAEAAIAENAFAVAAGRAGEASAANAAATSTVIGGTGVGLIGLGIVAGVAYGAIRQFQDQVKDSGALDAYAEKLNLTDAQIKQLGGSVTYVGHNIKEVHGITVSFGDVMHGVWQEISSEVSDPHPWNGLASNAIGAFNAILSGWNKVSAGISAGLRFFGQVGTTIFSSLHGGSAPLPGLGDFKKLYDDELKRNQTAFSGIKGGAIDHRDATMRSLSAGNNPPKARSGGRSAGSNDKQSPIETELAKLGVQITAENALTQAYLAGDAAVIKAEADQKALTLAVEKHANAAQTDALKQKELALAIATITTAGAKQISNLNADAAVRQKVNAMVAAGIIPANAANQAIANELALRQQVAALTLAQDDLAGAVHAKDLKRIDDDIAAIKRLQGVIAGLPVSQAADDAAKNVTAAQAQIEANKNEIAQLQLKNQLLGHSNEEIATALANLQTMQYLKDHPGIDASTAADLANTNVQKALLNVQSPFQQWAATIPQDAKAVTDALQQIEFKGFDQLASSITEVIMGTKSLGAAFKDIAQSIIGDIIQMTIKMLIFRAISGMFGQPSINSVTQLDHGTMLIQQAKGGVWSGGNIVPFATGGIINSPTMFPISGGRTGLMGEAGPEAVMPLARDSSGRLGVRANDNTRGPIEVHLLVDTSENLDTKFAAQVVGGMQQAVKVSVKHTNDTLRSIGRQKL